MQQQSEDCECGGSGIVLLRKQFRYCKCFPLAKRWKDALIPPRYFDAPERPYIGSALIQGLTGRGKTRAAIGMLKGWAGADSKLGGKFVDLVSLEMGRREDVGAQRFPRGNQFLTAPFVVADDLARGERITDFWGEFLSSFICARYNSNLPTVFTANFSLNDLEAKIGAHLASRIREMVGANLFSMTGKDWRREPSAAQSV